MNWIWSIIIIAGYILYRFIQDVKKDEQDLSNETMLEKFSVIVQRINEVECKDQGDVLIESARDFNLYKEGDNQIFLFNYGTGHLTIWGKYKYFHKEMVFEKTFYDVRNISTIQQHNIADAFIVEYEQKKLEHQKEVLRGR